MRVGEIIVDIAPVIGLDDTIAAAARVMRDANASCLTVVDGDSKVVGVMTERDMALGCLLEGHISWKCEVFRHMTIQAEAMSRDADIIDAAFVMIEKDISYLPIVEGGRVVGLVQSSDVFEAREREAAYIPAA
ncbi:MAG: CBS domain-containing protein [Chloroflexi bacterium]|nr:CBS domain-containing protein [Chloroflexota bacterium]